MRNIQGDPIFEERFEKIYSDYFPRMYLYARKLLKSDHLAEDVVAEVFYNLLKTKSDFSEVKEIETYLLIQSIPAIREIQWKCTISISAQRTSTILPLPSSPHCAPNTTTDPT